MTDQPPVPPSGTPPPPPGSPPPPGGGMAPPPPPSGGAPPPPVGGDSDRKMMLILSYLGLLALIPLIVKKDDREVQWHAKNGLAMLVAIFIVFIAAWVLTMMLPDWIGCALSVAECILAIGYLVVVIMAIMKALNGQRFRVPGISDFADKI